MHVIILSVSRSSRLDNVAFLLGNDLKWFFVFLVTTLYFERLVIKGYGKQTIFKQNLCSAIATCGSRFFGNPLWLHAIIGATRRISL